MVIEKMTDKLNINFSLVQRLNVFVLCGIVFFLPIYHKYLSLLIVFWVLTSIILIFKMKLKFERNISLLLMKVFYFLLAIGLLWSENKGAGQFDLEVKMSLFIFPLMFSFIQYKKDEIRYILRSFLLGILISMIYLLSSAYLRFQMTHSIDSFFYVYMSKIIHPSYLSLYVVLGMVILIESLKNREFKIFKQKNIVYILISVFYIFNILLLSKIGIIVSILLMFYYMIKWLILSKTYWVGVVVVIVMSLSFYGLYNYSPYLKQRVDEVVNSFSKNNSKDSSTAIRVKVWKESFVLIKEKPLLGYGTGDVKDVLAERYRLNHIDSALHKKLNAHNQFLQIAIALGLVGFLFFVYILFSSIKEGIENKNPFLVGFIVLSIFYMLPESVLEKQAGTIFFGLFFSLLHQKALFSSKNEAKSKSN